MKSDSTIEKSDSSGQIDAMAATDENPSHPSKIIFFLLCAMPVSATVAFGAADVWALGALAFFAGLIALLRLIDAGLKKEFGFDTNPLQLPILALILIGAVQLLPLRAPTIPDELLSVPAINSLSLAPYATRLAIVQLIVYFVFFSAALFYVNNQIRLRKIVSLAVIFSSLMAFFAILQRFSNSEAIYGLRVPNQANPFGSYVNGHHFAAFLEMTIGLTLGLVFGGAMKNNRRIFFLIAAVVMGMAILFSSSRGGLLSLLGVVVFVVAANLLSRRRLAGENNSLSEGDKNFRRNFAFIGGGAALIVILFGAVLMLGGDDWLLRGIGLENQADASNGRTHFWQIAWQIFLDYPILGAGLDSFGTAFPHYDTWNGRFRVEQAHNDYLQILADAGIAGFCCVAAFIYLLFKRGWQIVAQERTDKFRRDVGLGALAGCFGILIHSFFDFPLRTPSNALFFLTLTVLATASISPPKSAHKKRARRKL